MNRLRPLALCVCFLLNGCSYSYAVLATVINGRLAFIVDPKSNSHPSCVREVEVLADRKFRATASPGDDQSRVAYGTYWEDVVGYHCSNNFPVLYGSRLVGERLPADQDRGTGSAKPLRIGVVYEVSTVSGATGYGSGAFKITADRKVINVPPPSMLVDDEQTGQLTNGQ